MANAASKFLRPGPRAWLCAKIGAGEHESAIWDVLTFYADSSEAELPHELAAPIQVWIAGYAGSDNEPILRCLFERINVSIATRATDQAPEVNRHRLIAKRSDRAMRKRANSKSRST